jgi:threonine dehydrogenase-like Zn-dependent dehydrogenase
MTAATMRAARLHGDSRVTVESRPVPRPAADEVLIRMRAAGICGSDLHGYRSPHPAPRVLNAVPGHEPCGEVVEAGPEVRDWRPGDRVVVYHRTTCMACRYCLSGYRNLCPHRGRDGRNAYGFTPDGGDAELMAARGVDLLPLPEPFDFLDGAVLACQPGTAYWGLKNVDVRASDRLLVTGLGPVGLLVALFARPMGAEVIGVDPSPERRKLAEALGVPRVLDPAAAPLPEQLAAIWPEGATAVAEASGAPAVHAVLPALCAVGGRVSIIGLGQHPPALPLAGLMPKEVRVVGSNLWPFSGWEELTGFVTGKAIPIRRVVTHELGLEEAPRAFELAGRAAAGKVVFRFD